MADCTVISDNNGGKPSNVYIHTNRQIQTDDIPWKSNKKQNIKNANITIKELIGLLA